ncbi:heterokaryon incompatibility protein-domain-containing protein [Mariannaea sp. PMI_226]|nr:heterokaryon incompatibility protein-domain-containing protein [Mariannaea sp. PMI_226]
MRLCNTTTLELHDFSFGRVPPYAILSHTWGEDELTFHEMRSTSQKKKRGFQKLVNTCNLARRQGFDFVWVDTCCIDKSSSAELTEAINSMFQWYQESSVCYVFLEDLGHDQPIDMLDKCRWVTRGWTLQELIAPANVEFYDAEWNYRGSKSTHADQISSSTGLPLGILTGDENPQNHSVAARMSWIASRQTTRPEDIAYCMLGIFGVNMPLLYGEGLMAFRRLQEEILRRNNDMTILAWGRQPRQEPLRPTGVLAASPSEFLGSGSIQPFSDDSDSISITNKGLFVSGDIPIRIVASPDKQDQEYMICLGQNPSRDHCMEGLILKKIGPNTFYRVDVGCIPILGSQTISNNPAIYEELLTVNCTDFYLQIDPRYPIERASRYREFGIHFPVDPCTSITKATPQTLWDATDRTFLRPKPYGWHNPIPQVLGLLVDYHIDGHVIDLAIFCDYEKSTPKCGLYTMSNCPRNLEKAFNYSNIVQSIPWPEPDNSFREPREGSPYIDIGLDGRRFRISATMTQLRRGPKSDQSVDGQGFGGLFSPSRVHLYVVQLSWYEIDTRLVR